MKKKTREKLYLFGPATILIIIIDVLSIYPDPKYIGGWFFAGIITFMFYLAPIAMYYFAKEETKNPDGVV